MRKVYILSLLVLYSVIYVNAAQVKAKFKIDIVQEEMFVTVQNLSSKDALSYKISFGDATPSSTTNSYLDYSHQYASAGIYTICLVVTNSVKGVLESDSICETISIVENSCKASFVYTLNNLQLVLKNTSIGDYKKVYWNLGDGFRSNKIDSLSYIYDVFGAYDVSLNIVDKKANCSSDTTIKILVVAPNQSVADFSFLINDYTVSFKNNSIGESLKYQWNFGDGTISSETNPVHEYEYPGDYQVILLVKDKSNQHSVYKYKLSIENDSVKNLSRFEYLSTIGSDTIYFLNKSIGELNSKYIWSFGDNQTSFEKEPAHKFAKKGNYNVCLTSNNNDGLYSTSCQKVIVGIDKPTAPSISLIQTGNRTVDFIQDNTANADSFRWNFGDGKENNTANPSHIYIDDSIYLVKLISYVAGNKEYAYQIVNFSTDTKKLICRFDPEYIYKESRLKATGKRVKFRGTLSGDASKVRFSWDFGDGSSDSLNLETEHEFITDSTYQVCFNVVNTNSGETEMFCQAIVLTTTTDIETNDMSNLSVEAFPNPASETFKLLIQSSIDQTIAIHIYEISGRNISTPYKGFVKKGKSEIPFGKRLNKGVYIIDFRTQTQKQTLKLVVN